MKRKINALPKWARTAAAAIISVGALYVGFLSAAAAVHGMRMMFYGLLAVSVIMVIAADRVLNYGTDDDVWT